MKEFWMPGPKIKRWIVLFAIGIVGLVVASLLLFSDFVLALRLPQDARLALGTILAACSILLLIISSRRCFDRIVSIFMPEKKGKLLQILSLQHLEKGPKIVCIGGGTAMPNALMGLKHHTNNLAAIVTMADSGGSAGRLRDEFGVLPPGDTRRCLVALSDEPDLTKQLFVYRFATESSLHGHSFGNLFLTALRNITGDDAKAIEEAGKILRIKGRVLPVTLAQAHLYAKLEDGTVIKGETNIDVPQHNPELSVTSVWLKPEAQAYAKAVQAIKEADIVMIGPGDLYTSIIPNLLVKGIPEALQKTKARKVYVCNLMTKYGETNRSTASMHLKEVQKYAGCTMDYVVLNDKVPSKALLNRYHKEHSFLVENDMPEIEKLGVKPLRANLLKEPSAAKGQLHLFKETSFVRHDPGKLAKVIIGLLAEQ